MKTLNKEKAMQLLKSNRDSIVCAGRAVFTCMAFVETIRPVVTGYQKQILEMMQPHIAKEWLDKGRKDEIILNPEHSYLMEDTDFQEYIDECHIEAEKNGFHVPERGYCPLLMAETKLTEAKHLLIETMEPITGIKVSDLFRHGLKDYDNYIELTLKMVAGMASEKELNVFNK